MDEDTTQAERASPILPRHQSQARRVVNATYEFQCCVVCGLQIPTCLTIAHLDHNPGNNDPDNLALMCQTHHWMYDSGLYPIEAIRLLRAHWQENRDRASHAARMKDAGVKAARTKLRSTRARKAWATRRRAHAE